MSWFLMLSLTFTAGAIGGVVNALVVWFFGFKGINQMMGVNIAPNMTTGLIYSKAVWGGLWGLFFVFVSTSDMLFLKAAVISLAPTVMQLVYVFPKDPLAGMYGLKLGKLTPVMVVFFNLVWAFAAAAWIYFAI